MLNIALIGCGCINHKHIEAFAKNAAYMRLAAVCDPKADRADAKSNKYLFAMAIVRPAGLASSLRAPAVYADYRRMLEGIHPDIITIATESGYLPRITIDCLNAGVHVVCKSHRIGLPVDLPCDFSIVELEGHAA